MSVPLQRGAGALGTLLPPSSSPTSSSKRRDRITHEEQSSSNHSSWVNSCSRRRGTTHQDKTSSSSSNSTWRGSSASRREVGGEGDPATTTGYRSTGAWNSPTLRQLLFVAFLAFCLLRQAHAGLVLNDHIRHFEPVFFDADHLRTQHHRAKRTADHLVKLDFFAHNRKFKLRLRRDASVFAEDIVFESTSGRLDFDFNKVYSGTLEDDSEAEVQGVVTSDGLLDAHVATNSELYYLEPANRYLKDAAFHTVMYKASDVAHPTAPPRCASQQLHLTGRIHTPWQDQDQGMLFETRGEPLHGPERSSAATSRQSSGSPKIERDSVGPKPFSSSISSKESSLLPPAAAAAAAAGEDSAASPNPKSVNPRHKAVTRSKLLYQDSNSYDSGDDGWGTSHSADPGRFFRVPNKMSTFDTKSSSPFVSHSDVYHEAANADPSASTMNQHSWLAHYMTSSHSEVEEIEDHLHHYQKSSNVPPTGSSQDPLEDFQLVYEPTSEGSDKQKFSSSHIHNSWTRTRRSADSEANPEVIAPLPSNLTASRRTKRSTIDPKKTTCMLYLQADHLFYDRIGSEEACIESMTRHVQRVNNIYKVTDFNLDGLADSIGFMIKRIKVHTRDAVNDPTYRFPNNYGVEKFLELFSEEDYDAFCLAYMFTYRDFGGGTLGLAWTGDLKNAGGVCEKNGHYRGSLKSLNTGIVTLLNYGKHVPPAVSHVTLAHEIGHNFGSPHDPEHNTQCTPGGEDGNYIMFARATSGDKANNNKFSPCSLKQINDVLNSKARDSKGCFTEPQAAICGNGVVEVGEECDCGWEEDCEESCCYPMRNNPKTSETPCTLRPGKRCSPSQGPCCSHGCTLKQGEKCRDDNGCRDVSYCDGRGPLCPPSINKPNKTVCNDEFVCFKGECTGSICLAYGLESCQCIRRSGDPPTKSCELCCKLPGEDQPCLSSFEWNMGTFDIPDMYAKPGTPCNNYQGYCDVFQKCREVDPSGPLATLRRLLLSDESLATLQRWVVDHWYAVLFVVVAILVLLRRSSDDDDGDESCETKSESLPEENLPEENLPEENQEEEKSDPEITGGDNQVVRQDSGDDKIEEGDSVA